MIWMNIGIWIDCMIRMSIIRKEERVKFIRKAGGKMMRSKKKIPDYCKSSRGKERELILAAGAVWVRPTMSMEMKTKYNRNRQKKLLNKELQSGCYY